MNRVGASLLGLLTALALLGCQTNADSVPTPTATAAAAVEDDETTATLQLVADRTEQLFEFDPATEPQIELLEDADLEQLIADLLADPELLESIRRGEAFYTLLGLIPPGTDLLALNEEWLEGGIAGLYRPELDRISIRLFGSFSSLAAAQSFSSSTAAPPPMSCHSSSLGE